MNCKISIYQFSHNLNNLRLVIRKISKILREIPKMHDLVPCLPPKMKSWLILAKNYLKLDIELSLKCPNLHEI